MAIATSYGAFIAGEWVHGEGGDEIEVRAPYDNALVGAVTPASDGAGRRRGRGREGGVPGLARARRCARASSCAGARSTSAWSATRRSPR